MIPLRPLRRAWFAAAALALLGLLVFLFVKTDVSHDRDEAAALALVRELKDVDTRWDVDALRMTDSLSGDAPALPDRGPLIARILHELGQPGPREALGPLYEPIRAGVVEKQAAFRGLLEAHRDTLAAIERAREALAALVAQAPAAKARDPRLAEAAAALDAHGEHIRALVRTADIEAPEALERALEVPLATLAPIAAATDPRLAEAAARAESAAADFLRVRGAEAQASRTFSYLTVGPRLERAAQDLSRSIADSLEDRNRWRMYLMAYAAALLLGLGYLASRLVAANAALRAANQELERRVAERTAELRRLRRTGVARTSQAAD